MKSLCFEGNVWSKVSKMRERAGEEYAKPKGVLLISINDLRIGIMLV